LIFQCKLRPVIYLGLLFVHARSFANICMLLYLKVAIMYVYINLVVWFLRGRFVSWWFICYGTHWKL